jgi:predicted ferric reductase
MNLGAWPRISPRRALHVAREGCGGRAPWRAWAWGAVYVALTSAPLVALLLATMPAKGSYTWEVGIALGFAGMTMLVVQFVLTARWRSAVAPFGIDVVYYFHRYIAYVLIVVVLAHPILLLAADPGLFARVDPRSGSWPLQSGLAATAVLLGLVATSAWRKRLRLPYGLWRPLHLVLALVAVGLGFAHMRAIAYYSAAPGVRILWSVIGASLLAIVLTVRVLRPLWLLRAPYRVERVAADRGNVSVLQLRPEGHTGFQFQPGQFAWLSLGASPFAMQEHPFSIASAPAADGALDFMIKALGDFTASVAVIPPGARAYVDGPYGAFSIDRYSGADGYVLIAGGIGVAPMIGMLRALAARGDRRRHLLLSAHSRWDRVPAREALAGLREQLDLELVFVLEEAHATWSGERGRITLDMLDRYLPAERQRYEYFICGPQPMSRAVEEALHALGIPLARMHTELFDMA